MQYSVELQLSMAKYLYAIFVHDLPYYETIVELKGLYLVWRSLVELHEYKYSKSWITQPSGTIEVIMKQKALHNVLRSYQRLS